MYNHNSILIAGILFVLIIISNEIGFRIGRRYQKNTVEDIKIQTGAVQGGILGILALLLGFTFSMALQRFDNRSIAQINEANAIGTTILRTKLLPEPYNKEAYGLLKEYIDLRLEISKVDLTKIEERKSLNRKTEILQDKIWECATKAVALDPRPVTTGLFISSLNEMIDMQGKRNALLQQHVPEVILFLLFVVFITAGALMGYSSGLGLKRAVMPTLLMSFLIVLVVFIIIDLDRPKRGIIQVKQDNMINLKNY